MRRGRLIGFGAALLSGIVIGIILWPHLEREWMLRRLFSQEAAQRAHAVQWWGGSVSDGAASRISGSPSHSKRIMARLEAAPDQDTFVDVASLLQQAGLWRLPMISTNLWRRRLDLILDSHDGEAARSVLDELVAADVARDDASAAALWRRLLAWPHDSTIRHRTLRAAAGWLGPEALEEAAAAARDDQDSQVRRLAWLLPGLLQPASGHAAVWRDEEARVAEAMLWAATATNPLDASPLLRACDQSPWPTTALPWLLSRSDDEAARQRLETLAIDGNRAAALHLAERWKVGVERLPAPQRAWLGGEIEDAQEIVLARWSAWRRGEGDVPRLLADPIAQDGSVWAAVLLAERIDDGESLRNQSRRWFSDADATIVRAGALLNGLTLGEGWMLSEEYVRTEDPALRRALRLAMIMAHSGTAEPPAIDRAYAWTVATTQPEERLEALMALLAIGDPRAVEAILSRPSDSPASAALLERAWLIERFLPDYVALAGPLCPWDDAVAALQFDIMAAAWALRGGAAAFDPQSRTFGYTVSAAPPR